MEGPERVMEYKGHTIRLTPHQGRCSLFAMDIVNRDGKVVKYTKAAGKTEAIAFENAKKWIDFDLEYEGQE
jgi:hypothetical protein